MLNIKYHQSVYRVAFKTGNKAILIMKLKSNSRQLCGWSDEAAKTTNLFIIIGDQITNTLFHTIFFFPRISVRENNFFFIGNAFK